MRIIKYGNTNYSEQRKSALNESEIERQASVNEPKTQEAARKIQEGIEAAEKRINAETAKSIRKLTGGDSDAGL